MSCRCSGKLRASEVVFTVRLSRAIPSWRSPSSSRARVSGGSPRHELAIENATSCFRRASPSFRRRPDRRVVRARGRVPGHRGPAYPRPWLLVPHAPWRPRPGGGKKGGGNLCQRAAPPARRRPRPQRSGCRAEARSRVGRQPSEPCTRRDSSAVGAAVGQLPLSGGRAVARPSHLGLDSRTAACLLVPLYVVLAAAMLAFAWRACMATWASPSAAVALRRPPSSRSRISLLWTRNIRRRCVELLFFSSPSPPSSSSFAASPWREWHPRALCATTLMSLPAFFPPSPSSNASPTARDVEPATLPP